MAAPFAALESRLNRAVFAHLSNSDATLNSVAVTGIFDAAYAQSSAGGMAMASTLPILTLPTVSVPTNPVGLTAVVASVSYTVAEHQPDGTGVSVLYLERVL